MQNSTAVEKNLENATNHRLTEILNIVNFFITVASKLLVVINILADGKSEI